MGVQSLWKLLADGGVVVTPESMHGKVLAIGAQPRVLSSIHFVGCICVVLCCAANVPT